MLSEVREAISERCRASICVLQREASIDIRGSEGVLRAKPGLSPKGLKFRPQSLRSRNVVKHSVAAILKRWHRFRNRIPTADGQNLSIERSVRVACDPALGFFKCETPRLLRQRQSLSENYERVSQQYEVS